MATMEEMHRLKAERDQLASELEMVKSELRKYKWGWPPGHFYSPIPSRIDINKDEEFAANRLPRQISAINLNEERQIQLIEKLSSYYPELPFVAQKSQDRRYYYENPYFSYGEGILLYCLMRQLRPKRIIEVGSGYSSAAMLDVNEFFLDHSTYCTFVDPFPETIYALLKPGDIDRIELIPKRIQDVQLDKLLKLSPNDFLFVDSSHVAKYDSDVNFLFFEVLPQINPGVVIHFHDIGYPFEYPKRWIYEGRAWNEAYLLRAFLEFNKEYEILLFNSYLGLFHADLIADKMPLMMRNPGMSIWLTRL